MEGGDKTTEDAGEKKAGRGSRRRSLHSEKRRRGSKSSLVPTPEVVPTPKECNTFPSSVSGIIKHLVFIMKKQEKDTQLEGPVLKKILNEMEAESIPKSILIIINTLMEKGFFRIPLQILNGYKVKETHKKQLGPKCKEYLTTLTGESENFDSATSDIVGQLITKIREVWLKLNKSADEQYPDLFGKQPNSGQAPIMTP